MPHLHMALPAGSRLGPYEILSPLGAGGMGEVYRARDTRLERIVALKLLPAGTGGDEMRQRRFLQEARTASALNHRHIVTIHDIIADGGLRAIVMELVDGASLQQRLVSGPLPVPEVLAIGRQVADALAAAHAAGIVHRDLKPANVMVTARGEAKVLDFGIAKLDRMREGDADGTHTTGLTMMGAVVGTAAYMSPEQARGEAVDARSDVFSFGVLMYEMISGRSPFAAPSITAVLHKLVYEDPPSLASCGIPLPPGLAATVQRAMAKKPGERFQSMEGLLAVLDDIATSRSPSPAIWTSSLNPVRGPARRLALVALVLAALVIGGGAAVRWRGWLAPAAPRVDGREAPAAATLPATPYEAYRQGQVLLERYDRDGYIDRSIDQFRRAIDLKPDYAAAFAGLGSAYWRKYRDQRDPMWLRMAGEHARRAVELDPHLTMGLVSAASVDTEGGSFDAAEKALADALRRDPGNADAFAARAYLRLRQRRGPEAVEDVRRAAALRPDQWSLSLMEGVILMSLGRHPEAVPALERAAGIAADSALVHRNLGAAYHAVGRYDDAARSFQQALQIKPDPAVYNNLGTLYFFRGLYDQAVTAFDHAVKLGANEYRSWANLADAYRFTPGREDDARAAYTRALQLLDQHLAAAPQDIDLASRRVSMLAKRGDCADAPPAAAALERASATSAAALYRLAVAFEACGTRDQALDRLFAAIRAGYPLEQVVQDPELVRLRADVRYHQFVSAIPARPGRER